MKLSRSFALITSIGLLMSATAFAKPQSRAYAENIRENSRRLADTVKSNGMKAPQILESKTFKEISAEVGLSKSEQTAIAQALEQGKTSVATALYSSVALRRMMNSTGDQRLSVEKADQGVLSIIKVASVADKGVAGVNKKLKLDLTVDDIEIAKAALQKKLEISPDMVTWDEADLKMHTDINLKMAELFQNLAPITSVEAYIQAIMDVKKVSKDDAIKIAQKVRDC